MSSAARKLMTPDEFLVWCLDQEDRYELVGGHPIKMMSGGTQAHDTIIVNLIQALGRRLTAPCRVRTADVAARMRAGNIRRPDVTIDCGRPQPRSLDSSRPTVFFEVLSPSTRSIDLMKKPIEYRQVDSLQHIVAIDPETPRAWVMSREDGEWTSGVDVFGLEEEIALPAVGVVLPMAEIYADAVLEPPS